MSLSNTLKHVIEILTHLNKWVGKEDELSRIIIAEPPKPVESGMAEHDANADEEEPAPTTDRSTGTALEPSENSAVRAERPEPGAESPEKSGTQSEVPASHAS